MNNIFKYHHLPWQKNITLLKFVTTIVEEFFSGLHYKYVNLNCKQTTLNWTYNPIVPEYLYGRPKATILHCLYCKVSSNKYTSNDVKVVDDCSGVFEVKGKEVIHTVNFGIEDGMPSCS